MYNDIDSMIDMQDSMKRFVQLIYKIFGPLLCKYQGICRSSQYLFTFEKKRVTAVIITPSIAMSAIIFIFLLQTRMYLFLYNYYVMED